MATRARSSRARRLTPVLASPPPPVVPVVVCWATGTITSVVVVPPVVLVVAAGSRSNDASIVAVPTSLPFESTAEPRTITVLPPWCRSTSTGSSSTPLVSELILTLTDTVPLESAFLFRPLPLRATLTAPLNRQPLLRKREPWTVSPGCTVPAVKLASQFAVGLLLALDMLPLLLPAATTLLSGGTAKLSTSVTKTASAGRPVRGLRANAFIFTSERESSDPSGDDPEGGRVPGEVEDASDGKDQQRGCRRLRLPCVPIGDTTDGDSDQAEQRKRHEPAPSGDLQVLVVGEVGERAPMREYQVLLRPATDDGMGRGHPV